MWRKLSSLTFAWWSLFITALWLGLAALFTLDPELYEAIRGMNDGLLVHWITGKAWDQPIMAVWFMGLLLAVGALLLNMILCTCLRLLPSVWKRFSPKFLLLLFIHLLMFLVLAGHASQMSLGHKQENQALRPGQVHTMPDGLQVRLDSVEYTDSLEHLRNPKSSCTGYRLNREQYHRSRNLARISFLEQGRVVKQAELQAMKPESWKGHTVTLFTYFLSQESGENVVGINASFTANPLTNFFFVAYAALVALYFLFSLVSWRRTNNSGLLGSHQL